MLRSIFLSILIGMLVASCGGGGSSDSASDPADINLKVTSIEQPTATANAGHSVALDYMLESGTVEEQVAVNFYIVNNDQFNALDDTDSTSEVEQYYLGTDSIEVVSVGDNRRSVDFALPQDMQSGGDYFILAQVDPDNLITEANEDDNEFSTADNARASNITLNVSTIYSDVTNIIIKEIVLEDTTVILDVSDYDLTQAPVLNLLDEYPHYGNAHIHGHAEVVIEGPVPSQAVLDAIKLKAQIYVNGAWTDLNYWDNNLAQYMNYVTMNLLETDAVELDSDETEDKSVPSHTVDLDINIPVATALAIVNGIAAELTASDVPALSDTVVLGDRAATELINSYNKFGIRVLIDTDNIVTELDETDNIYEAYVNVYSLPGTRASSDYMIEKDYVKSKGKKSKVKAKLDMYTRTGLQTNTKYGVIEKSEISMPFYILKKSADLFKVSDQHSAYVNSLGDTGYRTTIEFFGDELYSEEYWADSITRSYERSWNKEKALAKSTFFLGPVPVTLSSGVEGNFGISLSATLSVNPDNPILSTDNNLPDMNFDIYASAGVGGFGFSAGPVAALTLIDDILNVYASATLSYNSNTDQLLTGTLTTKVKNDMKTIYGKFGLYVKYRTAKWCKKWGVPYPCGTKKKKKYKWYYKTKALYDKKATLLNKSKSWSF